MLVVDIFANEVGQLWALFCAVNFRVSEAKLVGMEVLLFFDHVLDI